MVGLLLGIILELVVDIEVGHLIGAGWTLLALLVIAVVGGYVVRREGAAAWRELNQALREGRSPSRRLADAALVLLAGLLLIVPGFLTDVLAVLLLLPTRALARRPLERALGRAAANRVTLVGGAFPGGFGGFGGFGRAGGGDVVTGEVVDEPGRPDRRDPEDPPPPIYGTPR